MYKVGDKIVYPMHGAGIIRSVDELDIFGEKQLYYNLEIVSEGMEILIPVSKAEEVGVRSLGTHADIEKMLETLEEPMDEMTSNWSKRYQDNMDLLKTGDIEEVAKVVKNLILLDRLKGLSSGEKKMLMSAKGFLISEMMMVDGQTKKEADDEIEDTVKG